MRFLITGLILLLVPGLPTAGFAASLASTSPGRENSTSDLGALSNTLLSMESPAEDMLDMIAAKHITKLKPLYKKLGNHMAKLNQLNAGCASSAQSKNIALLNSWFDLISLEMKEMDDPPALAYAINQFSGQLIVTTEFKHAYEKNVDWMDYLGREIVLLSRRRDSSVSLIRTRNTDLQKTWNSIKPLLKKNQQGVVLIRQVDPLIHQLMLESHPEKRILLAEQEQKWVDKIENFFHID